MSVTAFCIIGISAWCIAGLAAGFAAALDVDDGAWEEFRDQQLVRFGPRVFGMALLLSLVLFALFGPFTWSILRSDGGGR